MGTLLHFVYEWSGSSRLVGFFAAVNERTWEHLKLVFLPVFLFTVIQTACFRGKWECLWKEKAKAALLVSLYTFFRYQKTKDCRCSKIIWIGVWFLMLALFVCFTYSPLDLGIFKDVSR